MFKRARTSLVALTVALSGLAVAPSVYASCSTESVRLYEDAGGGGDSILFCVYDYNLNNNPHTPPGLCNAFFKVGDDWNDCVSSIRVNLTATRCLALYHNELFGSLLGKVWGPQSGAIWQLSGQNDDSLTSFKFYNKTPATPVGNC